MTLLEVSRLVKRFGGLTATDGVDLTVESGELTPSMKVKRSVVETNNKDILDAFYA